MRRPKTSGFALQWNIGLNDKTREIKMAIQRNLDVIAAVGNVRYRFN